MYATAPTNYSFTDLLLVLHDAPSVSSDRDKHILSLYFSDIYKLLVSRLAQFEAAAEFSQVDATRIKSLADELIRVKSLLGGTFSEER